MYRHASKTWALVLEDFNHQWQNDKDMTHTMRGMSIDDDDDDVRLNFASQEARPSLQHSHSLCWAGHVECSERPMTKVHDATVEGRKRRGQPKMTWEDVFQRTGKNWA